MEAEAEAARVEAEIVEREASAADRTDEDVLEELGLPDPETLEAGDDFKGFMSSAVPERLKQRALRRLWRLNPVLANVDGLVDYGEDFTDAATVIEGLQTTYQVGKGMLAHVEELARKAEAEARPEADDDAGPVDERDGEERNGEERNGEERDGSDAAEPGITVATAETAQLAGYPEVHAPTLPLPQDMWRAEPADAPNDPGDAATAVPVDAGLEEYDLHPPRRRMRFHFEESAPA